MPKTSASWRTKLKLILPAIAYFSFFALAGSAEAATYYIKTGGNNSSACTSDATACATWAGVTAKNPAAGSDVYFKCGNTYTSTAVSSVTWNGTAIASAIIYNFTNNGSNTLVTTVAVHGFSTGDSITLEGTKDYDGTYTISSASGSTFIIPHAYVTADGPGKGGLMGFAHKGINRAVVGAYYMNGGTETVGVSGARPIIDGGWNTSGNYNGAGIEVSDKDYVTVENLEVKNQWRRGIVVDYGSRYTTVHNCSINEILTIGLLFNHASIGAIFTNNLVYHAARDHWDSPGYVYPGYSGWSAAGASKYDTAYYVFRYNTFRHNYGEAWCHDPKSSNGLMEYNVFYENYCITGIYLNDGREATMRYNLIYGGTDPTYHRSGKPAVGICLSGENQARDSTYDGHLDVYGNFIANCSTGIEMWGGTPGVVGLLQVPRTDLNIYNNTIVSPLVYGIKMEQLFSDINVKNNIIYNNAGATLVDLNVNNYGNSTNIVFDYNLWSSGVPTPTLARGSHDPAYGAPTLSKTTGWTSIAGGSLSVSDFRKQTGSRGIDNGTPLGLRDYWKRTLTDIGADDYLAGGADTTAPSAPGGLAVR